ncbi:putative GPI-anchored protein 46 [Candida viswanathii]|uniref:Putative GPI-anchored protein 46 n=1 Tax=Candida viswanathii TaxID=5486 RepID=A0A367YLG7_9ASCO|nr:putative GPI-anchored protein 46 [Candida viswanathii]
MNPYLLVPLVLIASFLRVADPLDVVINDEEIDNPAMIIKSKFKQYLPELQENLEIPVTEKQQSIRESFVPKKYTYHHYGLRSRFRKDVVMSTTTTTVSHGPTSTLTKTSTATDSGSEDEDFEWDSNDEDAKPSSVTAKPTDTPKVHSRRSWVKDFLMFKEQEHTVKTKSKSRGKSRTEEKPTNTKLQSKITNYDDAASDPRDLKRWVRLIADEGKDQPYVQAKYVYNNEIELDIEEFIRYLVEEQGFNSTDLDFLRSKNLDYGLGEIEQELNKLKEAKGSPKVIDIGGEHDSDGSDSGSVAYRFRYPTNSYLAAFIGCLLLF